MKKILVVLVACLPIVCIPVVTNGWSTQMISQRSAVNGTLPPSSFIPVAPGNQVPLNPSAWMNWRSLTQFIRSLDGRYIVFHSNASNGIPNQNNTYYDPYYMQNMTYDMIYYRDTKLWITSGVTLNPDWNPWTWNRWWSYAIGMSANGRYVFFQSTDIDLVKPDVPLTNQHAYVRDMWSGTTTIVNTSATWVRSNWFARVAYITPDGRYVVFEDRATNLVPWDNLNTNDYFLKDLQTNEIKLISIANSWPQQGPNKLGQFLGLSQDVRYALFSSAATNLVPWDTNWVNDVFLRDMVNNTTTRISVSAQWNQLTQQSHFIQSTNAMSDNGRYVIFNTTDANVIPGSNDTNWWRDAFRLDTTTNTLKAINTTLTWKIWNGSMWPTWMTPDWRYVYFTSTASDLVSKDTNWVQDVFVRDMQKNITTRVSLSSTWGQLAIGSSAPMNWITPNANSVLFSTNANNVVSGDTNWFTDLFIRHRLLKSTTAVSTDSYWNIGNNTTSQPWWEMSKNGRYVWFLSSASNLVSGDTNWFDDVFVKDVRDYLLYSDLGGAYLFYYPHWLTYKRTTAWSVLVSLTSAKWNVFDQISPLITVSKSIYATNIFMNTALDQLITDTTTKFTRLSRNTLVVSQQIEQLADGTPVKQLHFTGRFWRLNKTFIVTFIKRGVEIYVVTASSDAIYGDELNGIVDVVIETWKFNRPELSCDWCAYGTWSWWSGGK